jgi:hypothetical protein
MIFFLIQAFIIYLSLFSFSTFLKEKIINQKFYSLNINETNLIVIIFLSYLSFFLNFFFPINQIIIFLTFFIILSSTVYLLNNKKLLKKYFFKSIIITFFTFIFLIYSYTSDDAASYHLPYSAIINQDKISFGLVNLHKRFGWISISQYLESLFYIEFINPYLILTPKIFFYFIFLFNYFSFLRKKSNFKDFPLSYCFCMQLIIISVMKFSGYHGWDNDMMPIQISFYIIFLLIQIYEKRNDKEFIINIKKKYIFLFTILSIYLFTLKISYSLFALFFLFLIFFIKKYFKFKEISLFNYLLLLLPIFWLLKNFLISGCLIYPMENTCLDSQWSASNNLNSASNVNHVSLELKAWSMGWIDQKESNLPFLEYVKNFYWLKIWASKHLMYILDGILIYLSVIFLFIIILKFTIKNKYLKKNFFENYFSFIKKNIPYFYIVLTTFFFIIFWFINFPLLRYGFSYIYGFILLILNPIIYFYIKSINVKKIAKILITMSLILLITKNIIRANKDAKKGTKFFSIEMFNNEINKRKINKKIYIYYPKKSVCFYSQAPCTHFESNKKRLRAEYIKGYKLYYESN